MVKRTAKKICHSYADVTVASDWYVAIEGLCFWTENIIVCK